MWSEERKYVICYFAHSRCIRNILTAALTNLSVIPSVVLQMDITLVCSPKTNVLKTQTLNFNICISHTLQKSKYENIKKKCI